MSALSYACVAGIRYLLSSLVYGHSPFCIYTMVFMRRVVAFDSRLAGSKRITDLSLPGKKHISYSFLPLRNT